MNIAVLSAGNGIQTRDLRLITEWKSYSGARGKGNATGARENEKYPTGHGAGVQEGATDFGEYTLFGGTLMYIDNAEGCTALFGPDWTELDEGDLVTLKIIHILSQATIAEKEIIVRRV
jgi:hypothetical protein